MVTGGTLAVDVAVLDRLALRMQRRGLTVGWLVPRLAAGLVAAGVEFLPALGVLDGLAVAAGVAALCGPAGLPAAAGMFELLGLQVRSAATAYRMVEAGLAAAGVARSATMQLTAPLGAWAMLVAWDAEHRLLPSGLRPAAGRALDAVDVAVEGRATVRVLDDRSLAGRGLDPVALAEAARSPAGALRTVAMLSTPRSPSTFSVVQTGAGPPPRFVVCLPGLQRWAGTDVSAADLPGAAATMTGHSSYVTGVRRVLADLPTGSEAVLVGHSQGGMVAQAVAAGHPPGHRGARVNAILTAGSPLLADDPPRGTPHLALVNTGDPVPPLRALVAGILLPAVPQQADPDRAVVRFTGPAHGVGLANHALAGGGYLASAASGDPRVRAFRIRTGPFFTGSALSVRVYQVRDGNGDD